MALRKQVMTELEKLQTKTDGYCRTMKGAKQISKTNLEIFGNFLLLSKMMLDRNHNSLIDMSPYTDISCCTRFQQEGLQI